MVFDIMAARLGLGKQFRFNRQESEREATRRFGEATLAEIYDILAAWLGWDAVMRDEIMAAELAEETAQLMPVPQMLKYLEECRVAGARVVFLSDMYLPSWFLIERLREHGFYQEGDVLMVSCEVRKSKSNGSLFKEAAKILGVAHWEHIGNHVNADVKGAKRAGLKGVFFPEGNLTQHETRLLAWTKEGEPLGAAWAAAARQARIKHGGMNEHASQFVSVAAGVAAPLLVAYVTWLTKRAAHHNLKRLYFLARDGQILRDLFIQIAAAKGLLIEARYLHASRIALRFPRQFPMSEEDAAGVFQANGSVPICVVALRLGIPEHDLRSLLPASCCIDGCIPKNKVAAERSRLLREYLQQEGLMDGSIFGIVDLGWGGSLQAGIQRALTDAENKTEIRGFYLGLRAQASEKLCAEAFAFDYRQIIRPRLAWFSTLAELFCQADHGSTLGFIATEQGYITALLDEPDGENPITPNWLKLHQSTIHSFTETLLEVDALPDSPNSLIRLLLHQLWSFYFNPSKEEAEAWGSCRFSSHGKATVSNSISPPFRSITDILSAIGIYRWGTAQVIWPNGSAARYPRPISSMFHFAQRLVKVVKLSNPG
jgi:FMN phosphatase YigB (HAD superfamily)